MDFHQQYQFYVAAHTLAGTDYSNLVVVDTYNQDCLGGGPADEPPGPLTVWHEAPFCKDGKPAVKIRWSASAGAQSYTLERLTQAGGVNRTVPGLTATELVDDQDLAPGVQHLYFVTAVNGAGSWKTPQGVYLSFFPPPDACGDAGLPGAFELTAGTPFCTAEDTPAIPLSFTASAGADDHYRFRIQGPSGSDTGAGVTVSGSGPQ